MECKEVWSQHRVLHRIHLRDRCAARTPSLNPLRMLNICVYYSVLLLRIILRYSYGNDCCGGSEGREWRGFQILSRFSTRSRVETSRFANNLAFFCFNMGKNMKKLSRSNFVIVWTFFSAKSRQIRTFFLKILYIFWSLGVENMKKVSRK